MSESNVGDPSADLLKSGAQLHKCEQVELTKIITSPGRRSPDPEKVDDLGHVQLYDLDDLRAQLAEIDENIKRRVLTVLEEAKALARRMTIYEILNPDTKSVTEKGGPERENKTSDNTSPVSFADDAAKKTGRSARNIQCEVEIAEKLDADAAELLRGTKHENSLSALKLLADLPAEKQRERAKELKAGAPARILRKIKRAKYRKGSFVRTRGGGVYRLTNHDGSGQFHAVAYDGGPVTRVAPSTILGSVTKKEWLKSRPAPNTEQLGASSTDAGAEDIGAPSDTAKLAGGAAEPPVESDATAPHPSGSAVSAEQEVLTNERDAEPIEIAKEKLSSMTEDQIGAADSSDAKSATTKDPDKPSVILPRPAPTDPSGVMPIGQMAAAQHSVGDSAPETAKADDTHQSPESFARETSDAAPDNDSQNEPAAPEPEHSAESSTREPSDGAEPAGQLTAPQHNGEGLAPDGAPANVPNEPVHGVSELEHAAESFARETSSGEVGDISTWDDQAVLAGIKKECEGLRTLDANYPREYHRLGTFIIEVRKRFGDEGVKRELREERIESTRAWRAEQIATLYTFEQAVAFPSLRAILGTIPPKQPRNKKPNKDVTGGGDHQPTAPHEPLPAPAANDENILDRFIQLGIEVRELLGDEVLDEAVEQIKAHTPETFEDAFTEVCG